MFTGIVEKLGKITNIESFGGGKKIWIESSLDESHLKRGNSIMVDGVCLTVEEYSKEQRTFSCTVVEETLKRTRLDSLERGSLVNLEPPLTLQAPIAGHLVSGHVDGTAVVIESGVHFRVELPDALLKFTPIKGSITLNGVSLTIADLNGNQLKVALIPETMTSTNLRDMKVGDRVNVEIDLLARYLNQLQST